MKKNILKATLVAAFALIAGFNVYNSQKSDVMSDLALANVEALAQHWESGNETGWWSGYVASTYMIYLPPSGMVPGGITEIPCCRYNGNHYNVCTAVEVCP